MRDLLLAGQRIELSLSLFLWMPGWCTLLPFIGTPWIISRLHLWDDATSTTYHNKADIAGEQNSQEGRHPGYVQ